MKHWKYTWFKAGFFTLLGCLLLVGMLTFFVQIDLIQMVHYGKQTFVGIFYLCLTWLALVPIVIVTSIETTGLSGVFGVLSILLGIGLNLVYFFGFGALLGWLLGHDNYR